MVQGKINRGRHTDHPAGHHSIWTNQCPLHRPPLNLKKHKETQRKPKPTLSLKNCSYACAHHCVQLLHTTQNRSDNLPSYTPDNHYSPDDVYWRGGKKAGGHLSWRNLTPAYRESLNGMVDVIHLGFTLVIVEFLDKCVALSRLI